MDTLKNILIVVLIIYGLFTTYLYNLEYKERDNYMKNKLNYIKIKTIELNNREKDVIEKEDILIDQKKCMTEVTRLRKVIKNAQNSLNIMNTSLISSKIEEQLDAINESTTVPIQTTTTTKTQPPPQLPPQAAIQN